MCIRNQLWQICSVDSTCWFGWYSGVTTLLEALQQSNAIILIRIANTLLRLNYFSFVIYSICDDKRRVINIFFADATRLDIGAIFTFELWPSCIYMCCNERPVTFYYRLRRVRWREKQRDCRRIAFFFFTPLIRRLLIILIDVESSMCVTCERTNHLIPVVKVMSNEMNSCLLWFGIFWRNIKSFEQSRLHMHFTLNVKRIILPVNRQS